MRISLLLTVTILRLAQQVYPTAIYTSQSCDLEAYPKVFGEANGGPIYLTKLRVASNLQTYCAGGYTCSSTLILAHSGDNHVDLCRPIIVQYSTSLHKQDWFKYIDTPSHKVECVTYSQDSTTVLAITKELNFDGDPVRSRYLIVITASSGLATKVLKLTWGDIGQYFQLENQSNQLLSMSNTNEIFLQVTNSPQTTKGSIYIIKINLSATSIVGIRLLTDFTESYESRALMQDKMAGFIYSIAADENSIYLTRSKSTTDDIEEQWHLGYPRDSGVNQFSSFLRVDPSLAMITIADTQVLYDMVYYWRVFIFKSSGDTNLEAGTTTYNWYHFPKADGAAIERIFEVKAIASPLRLVILKANYQTNMERKAEVVKIDLVNSVYVTAKVDMGTGLQFQDGRVLQDGKFYITGYMDPPNFINPGHSICHTQAFIQFSQNDTNCFGLTTIDESQAPLQQAYVLSITLVDSAGGDLFMPLDVVTSQISIDSPSPTIVMPFDTSLLYDYTSTLCSSKQATVVTTQTLPSPCQLEYYIGLSSEQSREITPFTTTGCSALTFPQTYVLNDTFNSDIKIYYPTTSSVQIIAKANLLTKQFLKTEISNSVGQMQGKATLSVCYCPDLRDRTLVPSTWTINLGSLASQVFEIQIAGLDLYLYEVIAVSPTPSAFFKAHQYAPKLLFSSDIEVGELAVVAAQYSTVQFSLQAKGCNVASGYSMQVQVTKPNKKCKMDPYPKIMACPSSPPGLSIEISHMDVSALDWVAIAGRASQACLVSFSSFPNQINPFLASYDSDGNMQWARSTQSESYIVIQIDYSLSGEKLSALIQFQDGASFYLYFMFINYQTGDPIGIAKISSASNFIPYIDITVMHAIHNANLQIIVGTFPSNRPIICRATYGSTWQFEYFWSSVEYAQGKFIKFQLDETDNNVAWFLVKQSTNLLQVFRLQMYSLEKPLVTYFISQPTEGDPAFDITHLSDRFTLSLTVGMIDSSSIFLSYCNYDATNQNCQQAGLLTHTLDFEIEKVIDIRISSEESIFVLVDPSALNMQPILYRYYSKLGLNWHSTRIIFHQNILGGAWLQSGETLRKAFFAAEGMLHYNYIVQKQVSNLDTQYSPSTPGFNPTSLSAMAFSTRYPLQCEDAYYINGVEAQQVQVSSTHLTFQIDTSKVLPGESQSDLTDSGAITLNKLNFGDTSGVYFNQGGMLRCNSEQLTQKITPLTTQSMGTTLLLKHLPDQVYEFIFDNFTLTIDPSISLTCSDMLPDDFTYAVLLKNAAGIYIAQPSKIAIFQADRKIAITSPSPNVEYFIKLEGTYKYRPLVGEVIFSFTASTAGITTGNQGPPVFNVFASTLQYEVHAGQTVTKEFSITNPNANQVTLYEVSKSDGKQVQIVYTHGTNAGILTLIGYSPISEAVSEYQTFTITLISEVSAVRMKKTYTFRVRQKPAIHELHEPGCFEEPIPVIYSCESMEGYVSLDAIDAKFAYAVIAGSVSQPCIDDTSISNSKVPFIILHAQSTYQVLWRRYFDLPGFFIADLVLSNEETTIAVMLQQEDTSTNTLYVIILEASSGEIFYMYDLSGYIWEGMEIAQQVEMPRRMVYGERGILYIAYASIDNGLPNMMEIDGDRSFIYGISTGGNLLMQALTYANQRIYHIYYDDGFGLHSFQEQTPQIIAKYLLKAGASFYYSTKFTCNSQYIATAYLVKYSSAGVLQAQLDLIFHDSANSFAYSGNLGFTLDLTGYSHPSILGLYASPTTPENLFILLFDQSQHYMAAHRIIVTSPSATELSIDSQIRLEQPLWNQVRRAAILDQDFGYLTISSESRIVLAKSDSQSKVITSQSGLLLVRSNEVELVSGVEAFTQTPGSISTLLQLNDLDLGQSTEFSDPIGHSPIDVTVFIYDIETGQDLLVNDIEGFHERMVLSLAQLTIRDININANEGLTEIILPPFQVEQACSEIPQLIYALGTSLPCLALADDTRILSAYQCNERTQETVTYRGQIQDTGIIQETTFIVRILLNLGPPEFSTPIESSLILHSGTSHIIILPPITDPDGDPYTISISAPFDALKATQSQNALQIMALASLSKRGAYQYSVTITLQDIYPEGTQMEKKYNIMVTVNYERVSINQKIMAQYYQYQLILAEERAQMEKRAREQYIEDNPGNSIYVFTEQEGNAIMLQLILTLQEYGEWSKKYNQNYTLKLQDIRITFRIQKLTSNGLLTLKFNFQSKELLQILSKINALQFTLRQGDNDEINLEFEMQSITSDTIKVRVLFNDPRKLSLGQERDKLTLKAIHKVNLIKNDLNITLYYGEKDDADIPPYVDDDSLSLIERTESIFQTATYVFVSGNALLNIFISGIMAQLWGMMNNMASLTILSIISVNMPGPARFISRSLISFAQFDIFPTDYFINDILKLRFSQDEQVPLSMQLEDLGFGDISASLNMGSAQVFCMISISLYTLLGALKILSSKSQVFNIWYQRMHSQLIWGQVLRLIQSQYITFFLSSLIQFESLPTAYSSGDSYDLFLCISFLSLCSIFPVACFLFVRINFKRLNDKAFTVKFEVITENLETKSSFQASYNAVELLKLQTTILALFYLRQNPSIQITVLYFQSVLFQAYIIKARPFKELHQYKMQILNEMLVTLYLLPMIVLTDYVEDYDLKYYSGWMLIGIYMFSFVTNMAFFVVFTIRNYRSQRKAEGVKKIKIEPQKNYEMYKTDISVLEKTNSEEPAKDITQQQTKQFRKRKASKNKTIGLAAHQTRSRVAQIEIFEDDKLPPTQADLPQERFAQNVRGKQSKIVPEQIKRDFKVNENIPTNHVRYMLQMGKNRVIERKSLNSKSDQQITQLPQEEEEEIDLFSQLKIEK